MICTCPPVFLHPVLQEDVRGSSRGSGLSARGRGSSGRVGDGQELRGLQEAGLSVKTGTHCFSMIAPSLPARSLLRHFPPNPSSAHPCISV